MRPIRVAIVGVGNCASALVQGLEFYRHSDPPDEIPGLMHVLIDKYHVRDIAPVAAFDVHEAKVGRDLADAIFVRPNNTVRFADVPRTEVTVLRGPTLDGLGKATRAHVKESNQATVDVARALAEADADVVVSFLPAGAEEAIRFYAQ